MKKLKRHIACILLSLTLLLNACGTEVDSESTPSTSQQKTASQSVDIESLATYYDGRIYYVDYSNDSYKYNVIYS